MHALLGAIMSEGIAMTDLVAILTQSKPRGLFSPEILSKVFVPLDLSAQNPHISMLDLDEPRSLQEFVDNEILRAGGDFGFGGYLEQRIWYRRNATFMEPGRERDIHIGLDIWVPAGTPLLSPLRGIVHSYQDNATVGDYGPTIILEHTVMGVTFHTLYGHLSRESLTFRSIGEEIAAGAPFATIGNEEENGAWPTHLHLQIIQNMEGKIGDYPGVASAHDLEKMALNCPDPTLLASLPNAALG